MTSNLRRSLKRIRAAQRKLTRLSSRGARKRTLLRLASRINSLTYQYDAAREAAKDTNG